jgi:UDP-N-acetylmuramate dehydrogenase
MDITQILQSEFGKDRVKQNVNLFPYLFMRQRVAAKYFFEAKKREDLQKVQKVSNKYKIPFFILGGGSNIVLSKTVYEGLVVKNRYQEKQIQKETNDFVEISMSSGYPISKLVTETVESGYAGFEYHKGLPGTVGGAIYMNAKWTRPVSYFGDHLISANIVSENGEIKTVSRDYFQFAYDYSILQKTKEILLEAIFRLKKELAEVLKKRADEAFAYRKKTQPFGNPTCGCFFRNPSNQSAGYLIDRAGLKGFRIGDFSISKHHANFIVNTGNGNPKDLQTLVQTVKNKVKKKFGVELEEEVIIIKS